MYEFYDIKRTFDLFYVITAYFFFAFPILGSVYFYLKLDNKIDEKTKLKVFQKVIILYTILFFIGAISKI
ncbi:hypothetical protein [Caloranaerobacter ferrireducens]|uniref:hypothetical protein n=1 Tax=Caloranaerobacter ferrireducens TaxID=1323370 RepID=UPI00084E037F|nr:hypothetical protein [Caloranaerobacter ferrireducens]